MGSIELMTKDDDNCYKLSSFAVCLYLVRYSEYTDLAEWHITECFDKHCGNKAAWLEENYPTIVILRQCIPDPLTYSLLYKWYANFETIEQKIHYTIVYGGEDN